MPEPIFVGREQHIRQFMELLNSKPGSPYILNLRGPGGIGKTKILQKIIEICNEEKISHTGIIDFYGTEINSRITETAHRIVNSIEKSKTEEELFEEYYKFRKKFSAEQKHILEQDLLYQFILALSKWTEICVKEGNRFVIIFDTFEAIKYSVVENYLLNDWLPKLTEAVIVISGRQEKGDIRFSEDVSQFVIDSPVDVFSKDESIDYLKERKVFEAIKEDGVTDKIFELTEKKPMLLALSADWIINYADFTNNSPKDLTVADFERKLIQGLLPSEIFEERLIERLSLEEVTLDIFILPYMAHIPRPFDEELLHFLFPDIERKESEKALKNLSELSFVKELITDDNKSYWFHDIARELFHKHLFSKDSKWKNRILRDVSLRMIKFYKGHIEESKKNDDMQSEQKYTADRLYHEIYLDPVQGMKEWDEKEFKKARNNLQYGFASLLLAPIRFIVNYLPNHLPEPASFTFELAEGRWMNDMADPEKAKKRFLELLEKYGDNDPEKSPYIYNALGGNATKLGMFKESLYYHIKSLEIREIFGKKESFHIEEQNIGVAYRNMGDIENAIKHLKIAYDLALNHKDTNNVIKDVASILTNLGDVYRLAGEHEIGLEYSNDSIDLLQKPDLKERLAKAKIVRASIYRRKGLYDEALKDIEEAIPVFEVIDYKNLAETYLHLGFTYFYKGHEKNDKNFFEEAKKSFETCIDMSRRNNVHRELMRALHEISEVYWALDLKDKARESNNESYRKARQSGSIYYSLNCLVKQAEFDYRDRNYESIEGYAHEIRREYEDKGYKFPLFYGRMKRIYGDIAFEKKNYDEMFNYYAEGLYMISQHGGYGRYTIENELKNLEVKLKALPEKNAINFCKFLKKNWTEKEIDKSNKKMIPWVDKNLMNLIFQKQSLSD